MSEDTHSLPEGLQGPIESGKTFELPQIIEEGMHLEDNFLLQAFEIDQEDIKSIILPKLILNIGQGFSEKAPLIIRFATNHKAQVCKEIIKAGNSTIENFELHFFGEISEDDEDFCVQSVWKFIGARVHAIDFGYAARVRTDPQEFLVEIDYEGLIIDGEAI